MARVLYFDCFSGISGDMILGAFLDAGLPLADLKRALGSLALSGCEVAAERVIRCGVAATKFRVIEGDGTIDSTGKTAAHTGYRQEGTASALRDHHHGNHHHHHEHPEHAEHHEHHEHLEHAERHVHSHRTVAEILALIERSSLSQDGRRRAMRLFERLAEAEAAVHEMPVEQVHLHEVGALDSIIDIVGAVFALEWAGADEVVCSPLNVGGGLVHTAHGLLPVPAPATVRLLGDSPIYSGRVQKELVTPTGALIATSYATSFGPLPPMSVEQVGYGAGDRDHPGTPNVLRIFLGRARSEAPGDRVVVIECEIDDMNPQLFGSAMERLYAAGALEVFYVPAQMKKNRPGTLLTVVAPPTLYQDLADVIFRETTTIGLRHYEVARECLERDIENVETPLGCVRFKVARHNGRIVNAVPEFEDCAALARDCGRSVKEVQVAAIQAYASRHPLEDAQS